MPQNRNNNEPPKVMTWGKAAPVLVVAAVFDLMRIFFEFFWFFGPALAALYCTVLASGTLSSWTFGLLGTKTAALACSAGAAAIGAVGVEATAPFGVVMAMAVGFAGWLAIGLWLMMTNARIFKENAVWFAASLAISEVPIVGSIPAISIIVWKMYRTQIKTEKMAMKKYEKEQAARQLQEQRRKESQIMQYRAGQAAQAEQIAANDAVYAEAANDGEIPEKVPKRA